jgi:hypothetical protein
VQRQHGLLIDILDRHECRAHAVALRSL